MARPAWRRALRGAQHSAEVRRTRAGWRDDAPTTPPATPTRLNKQRARTRPTARRHRRRVLRRLPPGARRAAPACTGRSPPRRGRLGAGRKAERRSMRPAWGRYAVAAERGRARSAHSSRRRGSWPCIVVFEGGQQFGALVGAKAEAGGRSRAHQGPELLPSLEDHDARPRTGPAPAPRCGRGLLIRG